MRKASSGHLGCQEGSLARERDHGMLELRFRPGGMVGSVMRTMTVRAMTAMIRMAKSS